ncbi:MAG TPA: hypothetical protein VJP02_16650 [Candidatus Sulfotelmatobacter sp.]|nr:hypothetical protein [Candidatus Sulfotelmatobacter sp.]
MKLPIYAFSIPKRLPHGTTVTGPEGDTVSFDQALKNGWLGWGAMRLEKGNPSGQPKGTLAYTFSNRTKRPIRVQIPDENEKGIAAPKTVDIPPGDTQQVVTGSGGPATAYFKTIMLGIVSISLLAAALFVILTKRFQASDRHWAYGTVGMIAGYWLKG